LRQLQNPNVHGLDKELTFRVEALRDGEADYPELLRAMSLNCSIELARGAFAAATRCYPNQRMVLKWGAYIVERHDPPGKKKMGDL
jgi:hypothetical protein